MNATGDGGGVDDVGDRVSSSISVDSNNITNAYGTFGTQSKNDDADKSESGSNKKIKKDGRRKSSSAIDGIKYSLLGIGKEEDISDMFEDDFVGKFRTECLQVDEEYKRKLEVLKARIKRLQDKVVIYRESGSRMNAAQSKNQPSMTSYKNANTSSRSINNTNIIARQQLAYEIRQEFIQCYQSLHLLRLFAANHVEEFQNKLLHGVEVRKYGNQDDDDDPRKRKGLKPERFDEMNRLLSQLSISNYLEMDEPLARFLRKRFAELFTKRNEAVAEYEMLVLSKEEEKQERATQLEILSGFVLCISVAIVLLISRYSPPSNSVQSLIGPQIIFSPDFRIFRGTLLIVAWLWSFVILIKIWIGSRINFLFLLRLGGSNSLQATQLKRIISVFASIGTIFWCFSIVLYTFFASSILSGNVLRADAQDVSALPPLFLSLLTLCSIVMFIWKLRAYAFRKENAFYLLGIHTTSFFAAMVGDYLTSSTILLGDIANMFCYVFAGDWQLKHGPNVCLSSTSLQKVIIPIIVCYPLYLRIVQNIERIFLTIEKNKKKHKSDSVMQFMVNALKYMISLIVVVLSSFRTDAIWVPTQNDAGIDEYMTFRETFFLLFFISSMYTFTWDVVMDWGMFYEIGDENQVNIKRSNGVCFRGLRMYTNWWIYPIFIFLDLILRLSWTLNIVAIGTGDAGVEYTLLLCSPMIALGEVFRRTIWSMIRMENEQLHNIIGYRDKLYVPLLFDIRDSSITNPEGMSSSKAASAAATTNEKDDIENDMGRISSMKLSKFSFSRFIIQTLLVCCIVLLTSILTIYFLDE